MSDSMMIRLSRELLLSFISVSAQQLIHCLKTEASISWAGLDSFFTTYGLILKSAATLSGDTPLCCETFILYISPIVFAIDGNKYFHYKIELTPDIIYKDPITREEVLDFMEYIGSLPAGERFK